MSRKNKNTKKAKLRVKKVRDRESKKNGEELEGKVMCKGEERGMSVPTVDGR